MSLFTSQDKHELILGITLKKQLRLRGNKKPHDLIKTKIMLHSHVM